MAAWAVKTAEARYMHYKMLLRRPDDDRALCKVPQFLGTPDMPRML